MAVVVSNSIYELATTNNEANMKWRQNGFRLDISRKLESEVGARMKSRVLSAER